MRRVGLFVLVFGVSIVVLILVVLWYLTSYQGGYTSMRNMMSQMMGNQYTGAVTPPVPTYMWVAVVALSILMAVGLAGLAYYLTFPEIRTAIEPASLAQKAESTTIGPKESWSALLRTAKPEEKKVLEVLASHDGKYLQKFVVKESGLSRLKTHRIISRFAERGIIVVAKSGNTNEVSLAPWLKQGDAQVRSEA